MLGVSFDLAFRVGGFTYLWLVGNGGMGVLL